MKPKARAFFRASLLSTLLAGFVVPAVSASSTTVVAYSYAGTLTEVGQQAGMPVADGGLGIAVGDYITGTFSYDSSQTGSGGIYTFTGSSKVHTFGFAIYTNSSKTTQLFTDKYSGNITAYYADQVVYNATSKATSLSLLGDTIYKSALGISGPSTPAFDLTLNNPTSAGGFSPTNLPLPNATVVKDFIGTSGLLAWDPNGLNFQAEITQFVPGLQGVPEPSSLVLAGVGMVTCTVGVLIARRKAARRSQLGRIEPAPSQHA